VADAAPIVYIVDDDPAVRRSLQWLVESIHLPVEALPTARAFLERYDSARPACLVLDLRMPDMGGLELQEELAARHAAVPIIMITGYGEVPAAVRALKGGAIDFLEKPFSEQALLGRIQEAVAAAQRVHEQGLARRARAARLAALTARERAVLALIVDGLANKQIAARLGLSEKTVEVHRARLMRKLEARSVAELVRLALHAAQDGDFPTAPDGKPASP
jgi:FixJ family two-component response regulator